MCADKLRMRRQGVEDVKGGTSVITEPAKTPRRKLSKAELRVQAAAAFLAWREDQTSKTSSELAVHACEQNTPKLKQWNREL
jgi:hypothetical protein